MVVGAPASFSSTPLFSPTHVFRPRKFDIHANAGVAPFVGMVHACTLDALENGGEAWEMTMASMAHDSVLAMFESRFDAWSARAVLEETLAGARVSAVDAYSGAELVKLAQSLEEHRPNDRVEEIVAYLKEAGERLIASAPAKPAPSTSAKTATPPPEKEDTGKKKATTDTRADKK